MAGILFPILVLVGPTGSSQPFANLREFRSRPLPQRTIEKDTICSSFDGQFIFIGNVEAFLEHKNVVLPVERHDRSVSLVVSFRLHQTSG
jgi:hypothetical protein